MVKFKLGQNVTGLNEMLEKKAIRMQHSKLI